MTTPRPLVVVPVSVMVLVVIRRSNCVGLLTGMPSVFPPEGFSCRVPLAVCTKAPTRKVVLPALARVKVIWPPLETVRSPMVSTDCAEEAPPKRNVPPFRSMPVASSQRPSPPTTEPIWSLMMI